MIGGISGAKVTAIRRAMRPEFASVKRQVERAGFALGSGRLRAIAALCLMLALVAPALGWIRLYHGIERDMPVGNLFALNCVLTTFALGMFAKGKHRSLEGDLTLEGLRESHRREGHGGHEGGLAYAYALTGTAALEGTAYADFIPALATRDSSSVSSDGCGGDSGCGGWRGVRVRRLAWGSRVPEGSRPRDPPKLPTFPRDACSTNTTVEVGPASFLRAAAAQVAIPNGSRGRDPSTHSGGDGDDGASPSSLGATAAARCRAAVGVCRGAGTRRQRSRTGRSPKG